MLFFSHSAMSNSLQHQGLQHARLPCLSPTPRVYSDSYPLSRWCHLAIASSVVPFSSCSQSFPASGSYELALRIRWSKYWSLSFRISSSNEYSELISFRVDCFDLLAVQGTDFMINLSLVNNSFIMYLVCYLACYKHF